MYKKIGLMSILVLVSSTCIESYSLKYICRLPKTSLLRKHCEKTVRKWFFIKWFDRSYDDCVFIERILGDVHQHGGVRVRSDAQAYVYKHRLENIVKKLVSDQSKDREWEELFFLLELQKELKSEHTAGQQKEDGTK